MKKIIYIVLGMFLTFGFAQEDETVSIHKLGNHDDQDYSKKYYYKDLNGALDKFLGTWLYDDGSKKLTLTFYKKTHSPSGKDFDDSIYAKIKYEENGAVIYNTLNNISEASKYIIAGSFFHNSNMKKMGLSYNEPTNIGYERISAKGIISPSLDIEYIPCTTIGCSVQLKWDIIFYKNVGSTAPNPFKIPLNLMLTKQ